MYRPVILATAGEAMKTTVVKLSMRVEYHPQMSVFIRNYERLAVLSGLSFLASQNRVSMTLPM